MRWSEHEENELKRLLESGLTYNEISKIFGRTIKSIKEKSYKTGLNSKSFLKIETKTCFNCGKKIEVPFRNKRKMKIKFCSKSCSVSFNNLKRKKEKNYCLYCNKEISYNRKYCSNICRLNKTYEDYITKWKNGMVSGSRGKYQISNYIRKYIFEKYGYKCSKCGWSEVNPFTNTIPLEVEHMDGDYRNNKEDNLILLCPNCHSLTKTYKGANKGKGRKERIKYTINI